MIRFPAKDPNEVLDYNLDFTPLLESSETLDIVSFNPASDATLTVDSYTVVGNGRIARVVVSGGTIGGVNTITCSATTKGGTVIRTFERDIVIPVQNK